MKNYLQTVAAKNSKSMKNYLQTVAVPVTTVKVTVAVALMLKHLQTVAVTAA